MQDKAFIFIIRAVLAAIFSFILVKFFRPESGVQYMAGLWIILMGFAYVSEYFKNRRKEKQEL